LFWISKTKLTKLTCFNLLIKSLLERLIEGSVLSVDSAHPENKELT